MTLMNSHGCICESYRWQHLAESLASIYLAVPPPRAPRSAPWWQDLCISHSSSYPQGLPCRQCSIRIWMNWRDSHIESKPCFHNPYIYTEFFGKPCGRAWSGSCCFSSPDCLCFLPHWSILPRNTFRHWSCPRPSSLIPQMVYRKVQYIQKVFRKLVWLIIIMQKSFLWLQ